MNSENQTAFISGHLDITWAEFVVHYKPKIQTAFEAGYYFVVGDAAGCDTLAQSYLSELFEEMAFRRVTVYHMFTSPRNNIASFACEGGFTSDRERDSAMTEASDYDIAWVRPGREKSGTAKNVKRRQIAR